MKRALTVGAGVLVLLASLACGSGDVTVTTAPTPTPAPAETPEVKAAAIADALKGDSSKADEVLQQHGMSAEAYESLLFEIAGDPARTKAFVEARKSP